MKNEKVPRSRSFLDPASHHPESFYEIQEETGEIKILFLEHPDGNRRIRRGYQQHKPQYTKRSHKGRSWIIARTRS